MTNSVTLGKIVGRTMDKTIYCNGRIFTANPHQPWSEALAVMDGRLIAVGAEEHVRQVAGAEATLIDLGQRTVVPGLCDSHIHLYDTIIAARSVPLAGCQDLDDMQARIAAHISQHGTNTWLHGQGWNESRWPLSVYPTRVDLDPITGPDQPAIFWRSDMHVAVCNSAALQRAGVSARATDPPGGRIGRDAAGAPNGLLYDAAIDRVATLIPPLDGAQLESAILDASADLHRLGITAIHDQRLQTGHDGPRMLAAYSKLHAAHKLTLRIHCNIGAPYLDHALALGLHSGLGDEWLRIGHVKWFIDGSLGSRTAWMLEPYAPVEGESAPQHGLCVTPPEQLRQDFLRAMQGGLAISVHAIGDRGNREVLDLFEELLSQYPTPAIPHRIEHVQILAPEDIPRLAALNLTASVQPVHALDDIEIGRRYLGARGQWTYAFRALAATGARLAFGSDSPVANPNPWLGIHAAVQRRRPRAPRTVTWHPAQAIDLTTALHAYTAGPAAASNCSHLYGTLEAGKCADFVVLGQDPFALLENENDGADLSATPVVMTVVAGLPRYTDSTLKAIS